ncbi:MAG: SRPBCC family protein [Myxococcaceae bacterium]|jgi:ribosome-associated toxin RatA of RatAB toxin-antitoxin module|nr:SRPBCC family protein [Myxococcaceae bacterium]
MPGASRSIVFNAPLEKCFEVISDYERYPEFLPEVRKIRTSNRKGNEVDVQYEAEVVKVIKYTVHMREEKPTRVSWTFIDGEFMKDNRGGWVLEDGGNGTTKATYNIEVTVGPLVPKTILNALVDSQLPKLLENFKKRIESMK